MFSLIFDGRLRNKLQTTCLNFMRKKYVDRMSREDKYFSLVDVPIHKIHT